MTRPERRRAAREVLRRTTSRQLARQQELLQVLLARRGEPLAVEELAQRLGCSERTVERDLERIRASRLPLRGRGGSGGGVWLDVTRTRSPIRLADDQVMGLLLALDQLDAELPEALAATRDLLRQQLTDPRLF